MVAFEAATQLERDNARYAYVYAVALHDTGQRAKALEVLKRTLATARYDRDVLSALVYYSAEAGDVVTARDYAQLLVRLEPENPQYARLVTELGGGA